MRTILYVILVVIQLTTAIFAYYAVQLNKATEAMIYKEKRDRVESIATVREDMENRTSGEYLWKTQFDWIEGRK